MHSVYTQGESRE